MKPGDIVKSNTSSAPWWMSGQCGIVTAFHPLPKPLRDYRNNKDIQPGPAADVRWLKSGRTSNTSVSMLDIVMSKDENQ